MSRVSARFKGLVVASLAATLSLGLVADASAQGKGKPDVMKSKPVKKGKPGDKGKSGDKGKKPGDAKEMPGSKGKMGDHAGHDHAGHDHAGHDHGKGLAEAPGKTKAAGAKKALGKAKGKDKLALEQSKHIKRMAKIERLEAVAKEKKDDALTARIAKLREKETTRHDRALAKAKGKKPATKGKPGDKGADKKLKKKR